MVAVCLFLVYSFSGGSAVASAEEIIPMAFHLKKGTVTLTGPVTVEQVSVFRDGGTIGVRLKDESGTRLDFCLDHRIRSTFEADKPYHVFVGGLHPTTLTAAQIPVAGPEEKTLMALLQSAKVPPDDQQMVKRLIDELKRRNP